MYKISTCHQTVINTVYSVNPMERQSIQNKPLDPLRWREEVYAYQRAGKMDRAFMNVARNFGKGAKVHLANPDIPAERQLIDNVLDGCKFYSIRNIPPVAIVDTNIVNAASVGGRGIFFTTGILRAMPPEQVRAVAGHELSHHRHSWRDTPMLLGIEFFFAELLQRGHVGFGRIINKVVKPKRTVGFLVAEAVGIFVNTAALSTLLTPWRWFMELESDKDGGRFGGFKTMGDALESLKNKAGELKEKRELTPLQKALKLLGKAMHFMMAPFGSHPPIDYRIKRMRDSEVNLPQMPDYEQASPQLAVPNYHVSTQGALHEATVSTPAEQGIAPSH
jgi:Zn-dependent protease with chaperone function